MEIKQLQYFVVSVDMGSFYAAAKVLLTTQPNVSKIIKSLEEELNMMLLTRNRDGVSITKKGEYIYRYAIDILKNVRLINDYKEYQEIEQLSIGSVPSNRLSNNISRFYKEISNKDIKIEFFESNVEDIICNIHRRKVELGFVYISNRNMCAFEYHIKSKGIEYYELHKTSLYLFVGKKNPLYNINSIQEKAIKNTKLIQYYEEQYSLHNHLGHINEELFYSGDRASISYTNSGNFLIQMLKNTDYGFIGSDLETKKYKNDEIRAIPIESCQDIVSFGYIKHIKYDLSDIAKDFISYLNDETIK